jgi:predicted peptidase
MQKGIDLKDGTYLTLNLQVGPTLSLGSPFQYFGRNVWVDYKLSITNSKTLEVWNQESGRVMPLIDEFDLNGRFTHESIELTYAHFTPDTNNEKSPLIIWLHGGGEGGKDTTVPLLANRAAKLCIKRNTKLFWRRLCVSSTDPHVLDEQWHRVHQR